MKKIFIFSLGLCLACVWPTFAQKRISMEPATNTIADADEVLVNRKIGSNAYVTVRVPWSNIWPHVTAAVTAQRLAANGGTLQADEFGNWYANSLLSALSLYGVGTNISSLDAAALITGTVPARRLSSAFPPDAFGSFTITNGLILWNFEGQASAVIMVNEYGLYIGAGGYCDPCVETVFANNFVGKFGGDGSGISNLVVSATNLVGFVATNVDYATRAGSSALAGYATNAGSAVNAGHATSADSATRATGASWATNVFPGAVFIGDGGGLTNLPTLDVQALVLKTNFQVGFTGTAPPDLVANLIGGQTYSFRCVAIVDQIVESSDFIVWATGTSTITNYLGSATGWQNGNNQPYLYTQDQNLPVTVPFVSVSGIGTSEIFGTISSSVTGSFGIAMKSNYGARVRKGSTLTVQRVH